MLTLGGRLRIETEVVHGRLKLRAYIGERELPLTAELAVCLAGLTWGQRPPQHLVGELMRLGVLAERTAAAPPSGRVVLSPTVTLELHRAPGAAQLETSLPISLFVPPAILAPLERLAHRLRHAWQRLLAAAASRGRLVDPREGEAILVALARHALAKDAELAAVVRAEGDLQLVPRVPLQSDEIHYPFAELRMFSDRRKLGGVAPLCLPIEGSLAELSRRVGELAAGVDAAAMAGDVVFAGIFEAGLTAPTATRRLALDPGTVSHLGHATLLANLGGAHVLVDPWFPPATAVETTPPPEISALPPLAAIFFTHHHWDHVHPETLLKLDKRLPVYLPAQDETRPLRPRTELMLRWFGFQDIRLLAAGDVVDFGDGGRVTALPFLGEDPTWVDWRGLCYVLSHQGGSALVHVDSAADRHGRTLASSGALAAHAPLSPVFATRRQERGTMIEHAWEFVLCPSAAWVRPTENCDTGAARLAELAAAARAPHLVLYSEGGADWYPEGTDFLRGAAPSPVTAAYEYLWDDLGTIAAATPAAVHLSRPYDIFRIGGGPL